MHHFSNIFPNFLGKMWQKSNLFYDDKGWKKMVYSSELALFKATLTGRNANQCPLIYAQLCMGKKEGYLNMVALWWWVVTFGIDSDARSSLKLLLLKKIQSLASILGKWWWWLMQHQHYSLLFAQGARSRSHVSNHLPHTEPHYYLFPYPRKMPENPWILIQYACF